MAARTEGPVAVDIELVVQIAHRPEGERGGGGGVVRRVSKAATHVVLREEELLGCDGPAKTSSQGFS